MTRLRRGVAFALFRAGKSADRVARLSHFLAAGTLRLADMKDSIRHTWEDFYESDATNDPGLLPWEEEFLERFVPAASRVLLIGCGSGRDSLVLAARGFRVTGIDPAGAALRLARRTLAERGLSATLVEGFFEDVPLSGPFDAVIFSYYCYASIPVSRRRVEALQKAAALLQPGGHVLVSHASNTVRPRPALIRLARLVGALCRLDWRLEPGDVVWDNRTNRPSYSYTHAFDSGELEHEAAAASLDHLFCQGTGDRTVVVVLRRP